MNYIYLAVNAYRLPIVLQVLVLGHFVQDLGTESPIVAVHFCLAYTELEGGARLKAECWQAGGYLVHLNVR